MEDSARLLREEPKNLKNASGFQYDVSLLIKIFLVLNNTRRRNI